MTRALRNLNRNLMQFGVNPRKTISALASLGQVRRDRREYARLARSHGVESDFPLGSNFFVLNENGANAGTASGQYFHQDLLVAQSIFARRPEKHIDVGSRIDGFVAHVATFRELDVIDIRPLVSSVPNIRFIQLDIMDTSLLKANQTDSLSCLHALEHFGLGRYGDPIRPNGWRMGLDSLHKILKPEGTLYLSVPSGMVQRLEFNAHRIFSIPFLLGEFANGFEVESLSFVDDAGLLLRDVNPYGEQAGVSFGATYGCSIWTLKKTHPRTY